MTRICSRAPVRISFAGGGTDVPPFVDEHGGVVLSCSLDLHVEATLTTKSEQTITFRSTPSDTSVTYPLDLPFPYDQRLDLAKAAFNRMFRPNGCGIEVDLQSEVAPGTGLGSSSTMVVAVVGLLARWQGATWTKSDIAELAHDIERVDMKLAGGKQDHYAAAIGGFNFIEFSRGETIVHRLRLDPEVVAQLESSLLLYSTGTSRDSSRMIQRQASNHHKPDIVSTMNELKQIAGEMKAALVDGRLSEFGLLQHEAWVNKRRMDDQVSQPWLDDVYDSARRAGAAGGKVMGAGGGGHMFFICPGGSKQRVVASLERFGGEITPLRFSWQGLRTWQTSS